MKQIKLTLLLFCTSLLAYTQDKVTITEINITGNKTTQEDIILREMEFARDSVLYLADLNKKIKKSKENLINLKLFNFIEINPIIIGSNAIIAIDVTERWYFWPYPILEVSERNFNSWWQEFQASKYSDFSRLNYGVFLNWENFRGRNELLKIKLRKGFKEHYLLAVCITGLSDAKNLIYHLQSKWETFCLKK